MKRFYVLLVTLILVVSLCACRGNDSPISTTRPLPNYESNSSSTDTTETSDDPSDTSEPEPTKDVRNEPEVIRKEIANMLRDAESLIKEGLYDDAKMVLRDLRSRNLTDSEKKKVDELYSRLNVISD